MSEDKIFRDIFLSCREHIARVVSRLVPPHDIEDIVQETYVRVCQIKSHEEIKSPKAFMTRMARNLALDYLKRAERRLSSSLDEETEKNLGEIRCKVDDPYNQLASKEEFAHFCEAVRHLPLQCRRAFVLKKVYGHSQREIARELNLSENTVEKHVGQGIKRCAAYMQKHFQLDTRAGETTRRIASNSGDYI